MVLENCSFQHCLLTDVNIAHSDVNIDTLSLYQNSMVISSEDRVLIQVLRQVLRQGWLRGTVGRASVLTGDLSMSYARPTADGFTGSHLGYVGKPSAIGQPTRPTQPFILPGSIK